MYKRDPLQVDIHIYSKRLTKCTNIWVYNSRMNHQDAEWITLMYTLSSIQTEIRLKGRIV
jgi:hypothetical protein